MPYPTVQDLGFAKEVNLNLIVQDLSLVATTSVDGGVKIWNAETGDCIQTLGKTLGNGQYQGVRCLRVLKKQGLLAVADWRRTACWLCFGFCHVM